MQADAIGSGGKVQKKKKGGQVGKRNQVVERRAGTSVNPCNSLRSEKQMKTNRQRLPGQSRSMVGRRAATLVDLCSALDNRLGNDRLKKLIVARRTEMSVNLLSRGRQSTRKTVNWSEKGGRSSGRKKIRSTINTEGTSVNPPRN